jgi:hypothetical protein
MADDRSKIVSQLEFLIDALISLVGEETALHLVGRAITKAGAQDQQQTNLI